MLGFWKSGILEFWIGNLEVWRYELLEFSGSGVEDWKSRELEVCSSGTLESKHFEALHSRNPIDLKFREFLSSRIFEV